MDADQLIHAHLGLAQSLAKQVWRTAPHALDLDELTGIANFGLVAAAKRWDAYCRENNFSPDALEYFKTFAVRRVYGAMMDSIRQADWATRALRAKARQLQEAGQDEGVSHEELARRTGLTVGEVRSTVRGMSQRPVSLEAEDTEPSSRQDVESAIVAQAILDRVVAVTKTLAQEQQVVVALHYHRGIQLQDVAKEMGITETRASQLHARAVLAIHAAMREEAETRDTVD